MENQFVVFQEIQFSKKLFNYLVNSMYNGCIMVILSAGYIFTQIGAMLISDLFNNLFNYFVNIDSFWY